MDLNHVSQGKGYLIAQFAGPVAFSDLYAGLLDVHARAVQADVRGALVDLLGTEGTLSGLERFELARRTLPEWNRDLCLAIAIRDDQAPPGQYGELFAQNRGFRVRVFTSLEAATSWIERVVTTV